MAPSRASRFWRRSRKALANAARSAAPSPSKLAGLAAAGPRRPEPEARRGSNLRTNLSGGSPNPVPLHHGRLSPCGDKRGAACPGVPASGSGIARSGRGDRLTYVLNATIREEPNMDHHFQCHCGGSAWVTHQEGHVQIECDKCGTTAGGETVNLAKTEWALKRKEAAAKDREAAQ